MTKPLEVQRNQLSKWPKPWVVKLLKRRCDWVLLWTGHILKPRKEARLTVGENWWKESRYVVDDVKQEQQLEPPQLPENWLDS